MDAHSVLLLDEYGQPLSTHLQKVLLPLAARLRRQFPSLNDDCTLTEVLEESGRRIAAREERKGPLDNLHAYAWVVVRRMAALRLRHDHWAIANATVTSAESEVALRRHACRIRHIGADLQRHSLQGTFGASEPDGTANRKGKECRSLRRRDCARLRNVVSHDLQRLAPSQTEDVESGANQSPPEAARLERVAVHLRYFTRAQKSGAAFLGTL